MPLPYPRLLAHWKSASLLGSCANVLGWDQEVLMPPKGVAHRADQLALLAGEVHGRMTDPRVGEWLGACEADAALMADGTCATNVREIRRAFDRATKLPASLVEEFSQATSLGKAAWAQAKGKKNFALFAPHLEKIVALSRQQAACFGWAKDGEAWDALADTYEPGMTAKGVAAVLDPLRAQLVPLIQQVAGSKRPTDRFLKAKFPREAQMAANRDVIAALGFDFESGRLDLSSHPFCSGVGAGDVRLTTRLADDNYPDALGSTIHEAGHGLYEQGLPPQHWGLPAGEAAGLIVHESQSRLWENQVARSEAFAKWCWPTLGRHFGTALAPHTPRELFEGNNLWEPSFIRVESDEATYHLHILARFRLERALLSGDLAVADLPQAWNAQYQDLLGLTPPDDAQGCLQDIHWAMGALGYFPTYTLGTMLAAQLWEAMETDLGGALEERVARGDFAPMLAWLREKIHRHGQAGYGDATALRATGKPLSADALLRHLRRRAGEVYGV